MLEADAHQYMTENHYLQANELILIVYNDLKL